MTAELKIAYMPDSEPPEPAQPATAATGAADPDPGADAGTAAAELATLWHRVQANDQAAFEQVYQRCSGAVYALCLRMTANRTTADDCAQTTFVQAWEKRSSFRGEASLSTWLHRIAVNTVLGRGRSEGRLQEVLDEYAYAQDDWYTSADASQLPDRDLERAIAALPERSRQVFVLHAIHGYKHSEVGSMMGIAAGTCKAHYHRSRELLRASLQDSDGSGSRGVTQ